MAYVNYRPLLTTQRNTISSKRNCKYCKYNSAFIYSSSLSLSIRVGEPLLHVSERIREDGSPTLPLAIHIRQSECTVQTYCQKLPFQVSLQYVQYQKFQLFAIRKFVLPIQTMIAIWVRIPVQNALRSAFRPRLPHFVLVTSAKRELSKIHQKNSKKHTTIVFVMVVCFIY